MMKQAIRTLVVKLGDKAAKHMVNKASLAFCYQPKEPEAARRKFLGTENKNLGGNVHGKEQKIISTRTGICNGSVDI